MSQSLTGMWTFLIYDVTEEEIFGSRRMLKVAVRTQPLPLFLRIEDRNSMAHVIETRLPFLDHRLVVPRTLYEPFQDLDAEAGLYNVKTIRKDLELQRKGGEDSSTSLFNIAQFQLWSKLNHSVTARRLS